MESVFANDTTLDLREMLATTIKQRREYLDQAEFCADCIKDINLELLKRSRG